jgi:hypothetical protein
MTSRCRCRLLECWRQLLGGLRLALPDSASEAVCCLQSPQRVGGLLRASIVDPTDLSVDQLRISKGHSHIEVHRLPGPEVDGELIQPGDEGRLLALDGGRDPKRHRLRACGTFIGQHQVTLPNPRLGNAQRHPSVPARLDLLAAPLLLDRGEPALQPVLPPGHETRDDQGKRRKRRGRRPRGGCWCPPASWRRSYTADDLPGADARNAAGPAGSSAGAHAMMAPRSRRLLRVLRRWLAGLPLIDLGGVP